jgi:transcriptional regulator of acetoin/glycerol metabolism
MVVKDAPRSRRTVPRDAYAAVEAPSEAAPHLFIVLESERPGSGGSRHGLAGVDEVLIGRGDDRRQVERSGARLSLRLKDPLMSGAHARIVREDGAWVARDEGSTNGTFVDGERIMRTPLRDGAVIETGGTFFVLRIALPTPLSTSVDVTADGLLARQYGMATFLPEHAAELAALVQISLSRVFVVLLGETGTGKEVLAKGIHELSHRSGAFVAVNCGALPETLVESQLFGYVKGAFSGAARDEAGLVRASDRGTLLLDEVGDLPKVSQAAMLRVLQESEVTSVGATKPTPVNLRVVSATHKRIDALTSGDALRSDLYARLAGFTHELLPLRQRKEDMGLLVADLLPRVAPEVVRLSPELCRALLAYDWPLNIRELSQCLAAGAVFAKGGAMDLSRAPEALRRARFGSPRVPAETKKASDDETIKDLLTTTLTRHRGNISEVARAMGRTRMQIHRWMKRFAIDPTSYRE